MENTNIIFQNIFELEHSKIAESFLNRFKFDVGENISSSIPNNNLTMKLISMQFPEIMII